MRHRIAALLIVVLAAVGLAASGAPTGSTGLHAGSARPGAPAEAAYRTDAGRAVYAFWRRGARGVPWVVNVHGGYWRSGAADRPNLLAWARHEQARGYAAFTVDYRLVPSVHWPAPVQDVKAAVRWIRAHAARFGLDPDRGFLLGGSAGGLLAAVTALDLGGFAGVVSMAGAVDPHDEYRHDPNPRLRAAALALLGGRPPSAAPAQWSAARAVSHLGAHRMPFLLLHSRQDPIVGVRTATRFAAELSAAAYPIELRLRPGRSHGLGGAANQAIVDDWMARVAAGRVS